MDLRRALRVHCKQAAGVRGSAHGGGGSPKDIPALHGRLGLQENSQPAHQRRRTHSPHGRTGPERSRRGRVPPEGQTRLGHCDGTGDIGQRLLYRDAASGKVRQEKDQRPGHPPGRTGAGCDRAPSSGNHRLPHVCRGESPPGEPDDLPLPRPEEV